MSFQNSYDGFIFDYGGVLVRHQTPEEQARMAGILGIGVEPFAELYWKERADYDKGVLSGAEYWGGIGMAAGQLLSLSQVGELLELDTRSWMNFDEPMWALLDELKAAGKRLAILSNMPQDLGEAIKQRTDWFGHFDHVTLSYEVRSVKPEAAIYESCLTGLGTEKARTVFFDDKIANIRGAEMLGISGVEFLDRDAVLRQVRG